MSKPVPAKSLPKSPVKKPVRSVNSGKKGSPSGSGSANEAWSWLGEEDIAEMARMEVENVFKYDLLSSTILLQIRRLIH
jgi:hypothetical protein